MFIYPALSLGLKRKLTAPKRRLKSILTIGYKRIPPIALKRVLRAVEARRSDFKNEGGIFIVRRHRGRYGGFYRLPN